MRLIDADALIEAHYQHCNEHHGDTDIFYGWSLELMRNAPTIDAVPVIRCKDCKGSEVFQNDSSGVMARYCKAFTLKRMVADDDYCSYGEREDNE